MKLNLINICTSDVARAASFFTDHFGFEPLTVPRPHFTLLRGTDGFILNLMRPGKSAVSYPDGFHVGFMVEAPGVVRAIHTDLAEGGWAPGAVGSHARRLRLDEFYCPLTDGVLVEMSSPR